MLARVLSLLGDELGFLVDDKMEEFISRLPVHEGNLIKMNNILDALGATTQEDIMAMIPFFVDRDSGFSCCPHLHITHTHCTYVYHRTEATHLTC